MITGRIALQSKGRRWEKRASNDTHMLGVPDADLVLLVTTRPTTGHTLAWAVACERDQWGGAIAAEAETLLSATLIHEVMHVLGFDPHAFAHFRDERKRRHNQV
ncbi:hypothetical protein RIF29_14718 [Crotalaria pallida]|uniref:Uncharacterized protein n=1 Tax=Crotalaria pallida TaxID=3830 RepID=A0AAN9FHL9_CROPI